MRAKGNPNATALGVTLDLKIRQSKHLLIVAYYAKFLAWKKKRMRRLKRKRRKMRQRSK